MLFGLWRRLAAVLSRFFMRILPQNIMLILLFLTVLTIVQGAGAGLGIDNLINDSRHIQQLWELNADKSLVSSIKLSIIFNSPTFWTSFFLLYTGGAIVVFSIGRRSVLTYAHRYTLWDGFKAYVMACGVYAVLLVAWITSGALQDGSGVGLRIFLGWLAASIAGFALIIALSLIMRWIFWLGYPVARGGGAAFWQIIPDIRDRARRLLVWKSANMWIVYPFFLLTFFVVTSYKLIPVIALLSLVIFVFLFVQIFLKFDLKWRYRAVLFALVVMGAPVLLGFVSVPEYKLTFEGIRGPDGEDHYAQPLDLAAPVEPVCEGGITPMQRVAAVEALDAWKARHDAVFGNGKPKLVVVATSGGAYRAGYWTAMVLDRIAWDSAPGRPLEGMAQSIRLIAGASGGMVGAGYFAALASSSGDRALVSPVEASMDSDLGTFQAPDTPWPEGTDPEDAVILDRFKTTFPVPGDSLSPVAQAMFRNDLPSLFWPTAPRLDRGKVLERQWRRMGVSYLDLFEGEQEGWRPSIVMSPTIVETGQPLLISNLDLSFMPRVGQGEVEDFFKRFPCSQDSFTLATAVRMNATFPLVSPAVSLPTRPARRVADAGYYDNYGISLVAAYLSNKAVRDWIQENTSGVLVLQLRAFPLDTVLETACSDGKLGLQPLGAVGEVPDVQKAEIPGHSWISSPVVAALSARRSTMVFRNEQEMRNVERLYPEGFLRSVVFVNSVDDVSLNWYLPWKEREGMRACFQEQWKNNAEALQSFWNREMDGACPTCGTAEDVLSDKPIAPIRGDGYKLIGAE